MAIDELITSGNVALRAGRWADARAAFETALKERETGDALFGMADALWWLGDTRASIDYHERAYVAFRRSGDATRAAWTAMWLGLIYASDLGNGAAFNGWIARAERLLRGMDPGPMQGWLMLMRAYGASDLDLSQEFAERALAMSRDSGDLDLELSALGHLGEVLVTTGQVEEGLALIDEAMAGAFAGEGAKLDTVVFASCSMLTACELAADLGRATQWCQVADAFIRKYGCPFLHARCRTSYGGILVSTGHWDEAERELTAAIRTSQSTYPPIYAAALARLADLRLRQGRIEEAEALLSGIQDEPASALPSAAIRLARGEAAVAVALLERRLKILPETHIEVAPTMDLLVDAYLAEGDFGAAAATVDRLRARAVRHGRDDAAARAAAASARVLIARGNREAAISLLEEALERFSHHNLPLETARVRLALARALAQGQSEVAVAEARSALTAFEQLGAASDADASAALLRSLGVQGRSGPRHVGILTQREREVLRLVGLGLSNPEIAERLVISRKTAAHHVSSVLAKLGLRNRAEAVAYATRHLGEPSPR
jgi:ATP/maltotriose-dependent transcriptional regulator MalT